MQSWTSEHVVALAPDAASASAGQGLAALKKWVSVGSSERAIWGLCQGSGKEPYHARVDLSEPAFKCSCPSRKFPCKHGLGLLLLFAKDPATFQAQAEPGWVADWINDRASRAEKKVERAKAAADKPVDEEAQAKRLAQRTARVTDGIASCRVWLDDLLKRGLSSSPSELARGCEQTAARMVDAQAPGLAGLIRRVPDVVASGAGWEGRALDVLCRLHLLLSAGERLSTLPAEVASDVRVGLGWNQSKGDVLASEGVADRWVTLGQVTEEEDRLRIQRTWLVGRSTGRRALVLDFAVGPQTFEGSFAAGAEFDGELAFYPSRLPLRAMIKSRGETAPVNPVIGTAADGSIEAGLRRYAEALALVPWTNRWPIVLERASLTRQGEQWYLIDRTGAGLPLKPSFANSLHLWRLLMTCTADANVVLAEWDGEFAHPLGAASSAGFHDLAPRWAA